METSFGWKDLATERQSLFRDHVEARLQFNRQRYLCASHERLEQTRLQSKKRGIKETD